MPSEINPTGESHHSIVYLAAMVTREELITFFTAHEWPCVKNKGCRVKAKTVYALVEIMNRLGYVCTLVVKHHANDIETRLAVGILEAPRLVNKYA